MRRQVADRYHLIQNLRDHVQRFLDRKRTSLPEIEDIPLKEGLIKNQNLRASLASETIPVMSDAEGSSLPDERTIWP